MRLTTSLVAIGSVASLVTAAATPGFEFPDTVPMHKRQTEGPAYECHASCGYTIRDSRKDGYCKDDKWLGLLKDCLDCALKYEIWEDYGPKVSSAAKACGLDATPVDPNGGSRDTTSEAPQQQTTTATSGNQPTDTPAPEPTTSAHEGGHTQDHSSAAPTHGPVETENPAPTASVSAPAGGHGNSTSTGVPPLATGAAAGVQQPVAIVLGAIGVIAVNMM